MKIPLRKETSITAKQWNKMHKEKRSEHDEQVEVVKYLARKKIPFSSMPNENKLGGIIRKLLMGFFPPEKANLVTNRLMSSVENKMKAEGKQKGYPDLIIDVANKYYHGLRIEMKQRPRTLKTKMSIAHTKTSDEQLKWLDKLNSNGYYAVVCYGADEAIKVIENYLEKV